MHILTNRNLSLLSSIVLSTATLAGILFSGNTGVLAENWPQFRGVAGAASSEAENLPTEWDNTKNILWKKQLPGFGASSPVVYDNRIYVTCYSGYGLSKNSPGNMEDLTRQLVCHDLDSGDQLWAKELPSTAAQQVYKGFVALHGYASSTPAVDETGVYVFYGTSGAVSYDHDGEFNWQTDCGKKTHVFGTANSPLLAGNVVVINASVESGVLIGLKKTTGMEVWRSEEIKKSWNTPALVKTDKGTTEMVVNTEGKVIAFDPANGEKLWICTAIDDYICPTIHVHGDIVYAIGGRKNTAIAIRSGGRGDVTESHKLWEIRKGSNVSSPVYHDGHLYWASEKQGVVYCADVENGNLVFQERLTPSPKIVYASPVSADGKIYFVTREMGTYVIAAKPEFELLARNVIDDDKSIFNGSPAIVDNKIILRSDKFLYCVGNN